MVEGTGPAGAGLCLPLCPPSLSPSLTWGPPRSQLYQELNFRVVLVGLEMWNQGDEIQVSSNPDTTLDDFLQWRKQNLVGRHPHDNVQLITYVGAGHGALQRGAAWERWGAWEGGRFGASTFAHCSCSQRG